MSLIVPNVRILENPDLFTNLALDNLVQIFGEDKGKAVRFMVPVIPENDLKMIRKRSHRYFFGE